MPDLFPNRQVTPSGPAVGAFSVLPSDTEDLPSPIRSLTIGVTAGAVKYVSALDNQTYTTDALPLGTYPLWAKKIFATGTGAAGLTGWI